MIYTIDGSWDSGIMSTIVIEHSNRKLVFKQARDRALKFSHRDNCLHGSVRVWSDSTCIGGWSWSNDPYAGRSKWHCLSKPELDQETHYRKFDEEQKLAMSHEMLSQITSQGECLGEGQFEVDENGENVGIKWGKTQEVSA